MHYHCEVIIPPTDDVEKAVAQVMAQFDENDEENRYSFWDWYEIGGRYAGQKTTQKHPQEKLDLFYEWMKAEKITVSGLQWGKQELSPADQIDKVDAKWREMFGESGPCPIFQHSNPRNKGSLNGDICRLDEALDVSCYRVIIAAMNYDNTALEAKFMLCKEQWNGCNYMPVVWDGKVRSAVAQGIERTGGMKKEYAATRTPKDDWLCVTVDYHC